MIMKKMFRILLVAACAVLMAGCGSSVYTKDVADYLSDARVESSALSFYVYDGSTTTTRILFEEEQEKEILKYLSKIKSTPVEDWAPSKSDVPFYGISIGGEDHYIDMLLTGTYAILGDGRTYEFNCGDLSNFVGKYAWRETGYIGGVHMPCSYYVMLGQTGWKKEFMVESNIYTTDSVNMNLIAKDGDVLELEITNNMGKDWGFGEGWYLEVYLDYAWYKVPTKKEQDFNDILNILAVGKSQTRKYDLGVFGDIPSGRYRLIIESSEPAAYEFTI